MRAPNAQNNTLKSSRFTLKASRASWARTETNQVNTNMKSAISGQEALMLYCAVKSWRPLHFKRRRDKPAFNTLKDPNVSERLLSGGTTTLHFQNTPNTWKLMMTVTAMPTRPLFGVLHRCTGVLAKRYATKMKSGPNPRGRMGKRNREASNSEHGRQAEPKPC